MLELQNWLTGKIIFLDSLCLSLHGFVNKVLLHFQMLNLGFVCLRCCSLYVVNICKDCGVIKWS